ncbi:glutathione S-transferase [Pisolithus croceorrhizus]|nr:glutathione S-transferase [Pisolithus croceorrhizus]KAI6114709.1 glutathione S-transferase [Pisolithus croceorrhizus]
MPLTIYGSPFSTCTRLVVLICKEKQIPFNFVLVDITKGEQKAPEYVDKQPFNKVPYIVDDDGFALYESRAIARYLIKKYADQGTPDLIPSDPQSEALFEQGASIESFNFNPPASGIALEKIVKPLLALRTDEKTLEKRSVELNEKLDIYDVILGKQKYLAGNKLTLADLQHLPHGTLLFTNGFEDLFTSRPNVARWWNELINRPAWQEVTTYFNPVA